MAASKRPLGSAVAPRRPPFGMRRGKKRSDGPTRSEPRRASQLAHRRTLVHIRSNRALPSTLHACCVCLCACRPPFRLPYCTSACPSPRPSIRPPVRRSVDLPSFRSFCRSGRPSIRRCIRRCIWSVASVCRSVVPSARPIFSARPPTLLRPTLLRRTLPSHLSNRTPPSVGPIGRSVGPSVCPSVPFRLPVRRHGAGQHYFGPTHFLGSTLLRADTTLASTT